MKFLQRARGQIGSTMSVDRIKRKRMALSIMLTACLLAGCGNSKEGKKENDPSESEQTVSAASVKTETSNQEAMVVSYTMEQAENAVKQVNYSKERYTNPSEPDCKIICKGDSAAIDQTGANFADGVLTINKKGTYELSGTLDDAKIVINVAEDENVNLLFNNFALSCKDDAAIQVKSADETMIYLVDGTKNSVSDGSDYYEKQASAQTTSVDSTATPEENGDVDESAADVVATACIYSTADLTFAGTGQLSVKGNCNDAIKSKDDIKFINGTYEIQAVDDAIVGKDSIAVLNGSFDIKAEDDAVKSSKTGDAEKGFVVIENGTFKIDAGDDGIHAETYFWLEDGDVDIVQSYEGYEASIIVINGGTTNIISSDDGINAASGETDMGGGAHGAMKGDRFAQEGEQQQRPESGGVVTGEALQKPDGPMMKGESPQMPDGENSVTGEALQRQKGGRMKGESPQMPEDGNMNGEPPQMPEDENMNGEPPQMPEDGNMNGEPPQMPNDGNMNDGSMQNGRGWNQGESLVTSEGDASTITINGGYIYVNASGDGLDANNSIYINGGVILIDGPESNGDGALDYDRECVVNAGVLIASGSSGMMQSISSSSAQQGLAFTFSAQSADTTLCLKDQTGNELYVYKPTKKFSSLVISVPELKEGETYSLYCDGTMTGTDQHGFGVGAQYNGGQILKELTVQ